MGINALVVDTQKRVGDNWRLRYRYVLIRWKCSSRILTMQIAISPRSGLGEPSPLHSIPCYMATLHPRWQACQLFRILRRDLGAQRLVPSHCRPYSNQVQSQEQHMGRDYRSSLAGWIEGDSTIHRLSHCHGHRSRGRAAQDACTFPWSGSMGRLSRTLQQARYRSGLER